MRVGIVGCGAMGSVYAALMADAGHEVWAIDAWAEHMAAVRERGLRVEGASGDRTVELAGALTDAGEVTAEMDLVILATKVGQVTEAATAVAASPMLGAATPVLSIQNGLGGPQRSAAVFGDDRVVIGVVGGFGASMRGPGHAHHNGMQLVRLGEYAGAGVSARVESIAELWRSSGFEVNAYDDVHQLVWEKLICNVAFSGPCSVLDCKVGDLLADEGASAISAACASEAYDVAAAKAIPLEFDDPVAYTREFGARMPDAIPSMLQDLRARRPCEIDAINGAIPDAAVEVGLTSPTNEAVAHLIRTKERSF